MSIEIYSDESQTIYLITVRDLYERGFSNWSRNRSEDPIRVVEIENYYRMNNTRIVPGIVSGWLSNHTLIIYDGIHRLVAAKSFPSMSVMVRILQTDKEMDVIHDFKSINKSVSVPFLYVENQDELKKQICTNIVQHLCTNHYMFSSSSKKPRQGNFNRDTLMNMISELDVDFTSAQTEKVILHLLYRLNRELATSMENPPPKCRKHDFYIFCKKLHELQKYIEEHYPST